MASAQTAAHAERPEPPPSAQDPPQQPRRKSMRVVLQEAVGSATGGPGWTVPGPVEATAAAPGVVLVPGSVPASARAFMRELPPEASPAHHRDSLAADSAFNHLHAGRPDPPANQQPANESCQAGGLPYSDVSRGARDKQKPEAPTEPDTHSSLLDQVGHNPGETAGSTAGAAPSPKQPPTYAWSLDEWNGTVSPLGGASIKLENSETPVTVNELGAFAMDQPVMFLQGSKAQAPVAVVLACPTVPESRSTKIGPTQALMQAQTQSHPIVDSQAHPKVSAVPNVSEAGRKEGHQKRKVRGHRPTDPVPPARGRRAQDSGRRRSPQPDPQILAKPTSHRHQSERASPGPSHASALSPSRSPQRFLQLLLQEQHRSTSEAASSALPAAADLASPRCQNEADTGGGLASKDLALQQGQAALGEAQQSSERSSAQQTAPATSALPQADNFIVMSRPEGRAGPEDVLQIESRPGCPSDCSGNITPMEPAHGECGEPKDTAPPSARAASPAPEAALPAEVTRDVNPEESTRAAGQENAKMGLPDAGREAARETPPVADAGDAGKASPGAGKGQGKSRAPFGVRLRQQLGLFPDSCLPVDGNFTPFSLTGDFNHPASDRKNSVVIGGRALRARPVKPDPKAPSLGAGLGPTPKPKQKQAEGAGKNKGDLARVRENGSTASDSSGDHGSKGMQAGRSAKGGMHSRLGSGAQARDKGRGPSDKATSSKGGSKQLPLQMPDWIKDTVTKWDWGPGVRVKGTQDADTEPWEKPGAPHPGRVGEEGGEGAAASVCMSCGDKEDETTLLCDVCENSCHMRCCKPALSTPPEGDEWLCTTCAQRREEMGNAVLVETVWMPRLKEGSGAGEPSASAQDGSTGNGPGPEPGRAAPGSDGLGLSQGGQWLLRGDWLALGKIRIGPMFQAAVPDWVPAQARQTGQGLQDSNREKEDLDWVTPFGSEVPQSEAEKAEELQKNLKDHEQDILPLGWLPVHQLPEGSEEERWEQCQAILVNEGDKLRDGKVARKEVQCGKWRRVPFAANLDVAKFDCSCCLPFDPYHADCAVPQEIPKKDIERRTKLAAEARAARKHKERECSNNRIWQEKVRELEEYKGEHGHCHMSPKSSLGLWLQTQRLLLRRGLLTRDRKAKLEEVGAALHLDDARWEENFARLLEFKKRHGHCDVLKYYAQQQHTREHPQGGPRAGVEIQRLLHWVRAQQQLASQPAKDKKTMKRICQLLEVDFVFK